MIEHAAKIGREGFDLADQVQLDTRNIEQFILKMPMSIDAILCGCRGEGDELVEAQSVIDALRERSSILSSPRKIGIDGWICRNEGRVAKFVDPA